jgi:hypothetical protein
MDIDAIRRVHDAAIALGAQCHASCIFNDVGAIDQVKEYAIERARALTYLQRLTI